MIGRIVLLLALCVLVPALSPAAEPVRDFETAEQRERYHALLEELRCLVCQNESLASSNAELAQDLRDEVYRLVVREGRSSEDAVAFLTERYGDFVLYRPPFRPTTWLLWLGPFAMLIAGFAVLRHMIRQRGRQDRRPLSEAEHARAQRLLRKPQDEGGP